MSTEQPTPYLYESPDNFDVLARTYPRCKFIKMRLVWRDPFREEGYGACDRWFYAPDDEKMKTNIANYISRYGILQAYMHKPQEKQNESDTQVSESGS